MGCPRAARHFAVRRAGARRGPAKAGRFAPGRGPHPASAPPALRGAAPAMFRGAAPAMFRGAAPAMFRGAAPVTRYRPPMSSDERQFSRDEHIVVEDVQKKFGDFTALDDIEMTVSRGQIAVIIGGSGAGKTTLLKILIGLDKPTRGAVFVDGVDIAPLGDRAMNKVRQKMGMVFQYSALLDSMNIMDNVAFPLREHTKLRAKEIRQRVLEKLAILKLEGTENKFPSELSGGMRKRVALARALMLEPEIIMYDEPTSGLDPLSCRLVDELIEETRDRFGVTSVVISHDMAGALQIADRIYLLAQGRLVGEGTPRELVDMKTGLAADFFEASGIAAEQLVEAPDTGVKYRE
jgi:phospholipid/cholesterol/gamma-HCH transport system ATP-binding protein